MRPVSAKDAPYPVYVLGKRGPLQVSGTRDQRIAQVAEQQRGRITCAQLRVLGVSNASLTRLAQAGRLYREHRGVYAVGSRLSLPLVAETAALLARPRTVLALESAGRLWGLPLPDDGVIHLLSKGAFSPLPGVAGHTTRTLSRFDRRVHQGLPVTSPARTVFDLSQCLPERTYERVVGEALARRLVSERQLLDLAVALGSGRRGSRVLRELLTAAGAPAMTRSEAEALLLDILRAAGLPEPLVNHRVHGYELDFYWPQQRLVVEVDGFRWHGGRAAFERDRRKGMALTAAGLTVTRLSWRQLREPLPLVASLAQALARTA